MEQSFADLLSNAFSETAVPSFPDGDLDFENLNFKEDKTEISQENFLTKEDGALRQEATAVVSGRETTDIYMAENVGEEQCERDEEDFQGAMSRDTTPEDDYTSSGGESEEEGSVSGEEDEEDDVGKGEKPEDLLRSVHCGDEFHGGNKEDRILAAGQPLAPEGAEKPQVRNEEQGESDEEVSYFERVPEGGGEMIRRSDGIEEDEQEREEEKECEGMKIEQEDVLPVCFEQELERPHRNGQAKANLDFPEISVQSLQDLIAEVDSEECGKKVKDFSGEEHQDAGESFADYPSDFSSCEYVEDRGRNQQSDRQSNALACVSNSGYSLERAWMGRAEDADEEPDGYLYSRDSEVDAEEFRSLDEKDIVENAAVTTVDDGGETGESDSYTSSDEEERRSDEELSDSLHLQDLDTNMQQDEARVGRSAAFTDYYDTADAADFNVNWNLDVLTTDTCLSEDLLTTDEAETLLSDVILRPAEDVNGYSVVQTGEAKSTSPSNQGSLDDSFFFYAEPEASGITELGQLGDDEYEEERNWEQEQERIKAFYEFYDDSDRENEREGRQIKVQFCAEPLSQVIHYETDSSDRDSLSSSTEGEEDPSSAETYEELREPDDARQTTPACDPLNTQLPENAPDLCNAQMCTRKHKCFNMLKLMLKMCLVILTGLLTFWFATDQTDWFSHASFF